MPMHWIGRKGVYMQISYLLVLWLVSFVFQKKMIKMKNMANLWKSYLLVHVYFVPSVIFSSDFVHAVTMFSTLMSLEDRLN